MEIAPVDSVPKLGIEPLTDSEISRLLDQTGKSFSDRRNAMMIRLMLHTGMRPGEVVSLKWSDIDKDASTVRISPAKWESERRLKISPAVVDSLESYHDHKNFPAEDSGPDLVFPNAQGNVLSLRYVRDFVEDYALKAGLSAERVHPYLFRHTFASRLLQTTRNIRMVQRALGHNDLSTTMNYIHTLPESTQDKIKAGDDLDLATFSKKLEEKLITQEEAISEMEKDTVTTERSEGGG
jgi:integrase/recombinase XerD